MPCHAWRIYRCHYLRKSTLHIYIFMPVICHCPDAYRHHIYLWYKICDTSATDVRCSYHACATMPRDDAIAARFRYSAPAPYARAVSWKAWEEYLFFSYFFLIFSPFIISFYFIYFLRFHFLWCRRYVAAPWFDAAGWRNAAAATALIDDIRVRAHVAAQKRDALAWAAAREMFGAAHIFFFFAMALRINVFLLLM